MKIELRAWNGKKMIYGPTEGQVSPSWILVFCETYKDRGIPDPMLYIGLKDKNGAKIYEGDIFQYPNSEAGYGVPNTPDDLIEVFNNIEDLYENDYLKLRLENAEIIGNIYENPELIEKLERRN